MGARRVDARVARRPRRPPRAAPRRPPCAGSLPRSTMSQQRSTRCCVAPPTRPFPVAGRCSPPTATSNHPRIPWSGCGSGPPACASTAGTGTSPRSTAAGFDGLTAHVLLVAEEGSSAEDRQQTRGWTADDWAAAQDRCRSRGWIGADGALTDAGWRARAEVEVVTDQLARSAVRRHRRRPARAARSDRRRGVLVGHDPLPEPDEPAARARADPLTCAARPRGPHAERRDEDTSGPMSADRSGCGTAGCSTGCCRASARTCSPRLRWSPASACSTSAAAPARSRRRSPTSAPNPSGSTSPRR